MQHVMASSPSSGSAHRHFAALVEPARDDESIPLAAAALTIARMEYPDLDAGPYLARLEEMAERVRTRIRKNPTARESITLLNRVLFQEEGLRGNREDFYDPRNSFLNDVLDRKLGIPITLSVVYMEVANRLHLKQKQLLSLRFSPKARYDRDVLQSPHFPCRRSSRQTFLAPDGRN
jgi:hypothetical protein